MGLVDAVVDFLKVLAIIALVIIAVVVVIAAIAYLISGAAAVLQHLQRLLPLGHPFLERWP